MLNLILCDKKLLENPENYPYVQMAFDGTHFYCCTGKTRKIYKLSLDGEIVCCMDTKRVFGSICFDCEEKCFWAIVPNCRYTIYKLDSSLCEIVSISTPHQDSVFKDISYSVEDDMLLMCNGKSVVKVSKSGVLHSTYSGERNVAFDVAAEVYEKIFIGCRFQYSCPDIIGILYPNRSFDYQTCMPKNFAVNSLCACYESGDSAVLFALATQSYSYSYLLKYRIETCDDNNGSANVTVACSDVRADITFEACGEDESCGL